MPESKLKDHAPKKVRQRDSSATLKKDHERTIPAPLKPKESQQVKESRFDSNSSPTSSPDTSDLESAKPKDTPLSTSVEMSETETDTAVPGKGATYSPEEDAQVAEINRLISQATRRLQELEEIKAEAEEEPEEEFIEDPVEFDGISNEGEHMELLEAELSAARKRVRELEHELETVKQDLIDEKKELEEEVRELRKEMHRTAPIHDHSFFSFSKEIKEAVKALEDFDMANLEKMQQNSLNKPAMKKDTAVPVKQVSKEPSSESEESKKKEASESEKVEEKREKPEKKKGKKKKMLITGGAAVLLLFAVSGVLSSKLLGKTSVNEELVNEYLQNSGGQVAGAKSGKGEESGQEESVGAPTPPPQSKSREEEYKESQADVNYAETQWHEMSEPSFGISVEYPVNAVNVIKTDSSMTFIRKNGYILKIQKIETALELSEYWKQIKATSLSYEVEERTFKGEEALFLQLEENTQYPGNRYLVKKGDFIYDIWYATKSSAFNADDLQRVEKMLDSFQFIEQ